MTDLIARSVPDIDYLSPKLFDDLGIVQTVVANDTVYVSGIAPLTDASGELDSWSDVFDLAPGETQDYDMTTPWSDPVQGLHCGTAIA